MSWLQRRLLAPAKVLLLAGLSPQKLTGSALLGISVGLIPVPGVSMALGAAAGAVLGLNHAAIQLANYAVYPAQLALLLPYLRAGEWLFDAPELPLSVTQLMDLLRAQPWSTLERFGGSLAHAVAAWALSCAAAAPPLYAVMKPLLAKALRRAQGLG